MIIEAQPSSGVTVNRSMNFEKYALGGRKKRSVPPVQISGTAPEVFVAIGRDYASVSSNPMTSFNIGFQELLPVETSTCIIKAFEAFVIYGLDPADIVSIGALHQKGAKGAESTDMHVGFVNLILKSQVRWNPYVEQKDRATLVAFTELVNFAFDLASAKDPERRKLAVSPPAPRDPEWLIFWKLNLTARVEEQVRKSAFSSREEFKQFVATLPDVSRVWIDKKVIRAQVREKSVVIMGALAGEWFYSDPDRYKRKTRAEYEADLERGLKARKEYHQSLYEVQARKPMLSWIRLIRVELPEVLRALVPQAQIDPGHELLKETLGLGKGRAVKPEVPVPPVDLIRRLLLVVQKGRETGRLDEEIKFSGRSTPIWDYIEVEEDGRMHLRYEAYEALQAMGTDDYKIEDLLTVIEASNEDLELGRDNPQPTR